MLKRTVLLPLFILPAMFLAPVVSSETHEVKTIEQIKMSAVEGISFLTNEQLRERVKDNPKLVLIDVRTQKEFQAGHLPGASWVERGIAEFVLARTLIDRNIEVIVYCKKGYRAALVVRSLKAAGYLNVSAHAGFDEWTSAGNRYANYLGESVLVTPASINSGNFKPDYSQPKL